MNIQKYLFDINGLTQEPQSPKCPANLQHTLKSQVTNIGSNCRQQQSADNLSSLPNKKECYPECPCKKGDKTPGQWGLAFTFPHCWAGKLESLFTSIYSLEKHTSGHSKNSSATTHVAGKFGYAHFYIKFTLADFFYRSVISLHSPSLSVDNESHIMDGQLNMTKG